MNCDKMRCPVCRATCCRHNEHDTCMKQIPGLDPGFRCPDFILPVSEKLVLKIVVGRSGVCAGRT